MTTLSLSSPLMSGMRAVAPTASTTAFLALGDALARVLLRRIGFGPADYARFTREAASAFSSGSR